MKNYKSTSGKSGFKKAGKPSFGGSSKPSFSKPGRSFSKPSFDSHQTFNATCSQCGKNCDVPFKPTGSRPVLCNACFKGQDSAGGRSYDKPSYNSRPSFEASPRAAAVDNKQFELLNAKLDEILKILKQDEFVADEFEQDIYDEEGLEAIKPVKKAVKKTTTTKTKKAK
jgi:CxxC-x17-CxxC domain-containing protein